MSLVALGISAGQPRMITEDIATACGGLSGYWMPGESTIAHATAACLDFSVARQGHRTAYQWSGEAKLSPANLVYVPA